MSGRITPASINFTLCSGLGIYKGAEWVVPVTMSEREDLVDTPFNLTGYTGRCSIKYKAGDEEPVATPLVTITSALQGQFTISLTATQTSQFVTHGRDFKDVEQFQYDVYFDKNSESYRALQGYVEVSPSIADSNDEE